MKFQADYFTPGLWSAPAGSSKDLHGALTIYQQAKREALITGDEHIVCPQNYKYSLKALQASLAGKSLIQCSSAHPSAYLSSTPSSQEVVMINGRLVHTPSQQGLSVQLMRDRLRYMDELMDFKSSMAGVIRDDDVFYQLSESFMDHGVFIDIDHRFEGRLWLKSYVHDDRNDSIDQNHRDSSQGLYLAPSTVFIKVAPDTRCTIFESLDGQRSSHDQWMHSQMNLDIGQGAQVSVQRVSHSESYYTGTCHSRLARGAHLEHVNVIGGTSLTRFEHGVVLEGDGSEAYLSGLGCAEHHLDQRVCVVHQGRATVSKQTFKSLAYGEGHGTFDGKMRILENSWDADARLLTHNLLLHDSARLVAIPELICRCDEVKASHGATVSEPSTADLWYLQSRGMTQSQAYEMLIHAFMAEIFYHHRHLAQHPLCQALTARAARCLDQGG